MPTINQHRLMHKKMFDKVWSRAGKYRTTEKNIGAAPELIPIKLMQLFHDVAGDYTELIAFTKKINL